MTTAPSDKTLLMEALRQGDSFSSDLYLLKQAVSIIGDYGPGLGSHVRSGDIQTIYIHPTLTDLGTRCSVYALPYPMKEDQHPKHIAEEYQGTWRKIATLGDNNQCLIAIESEYTDVGESLIGQMAGSYFIHVTQSARQRRDENHALPAQSLRPRG